MEIKQSILNLNVVTYREKSKMIYQGLMIKLEILRNNVKILTENAKVKMQEPKKMEIELKI